MKILGGIAILVSVFAWLVGYSSTHVRLSAISFLIGVSLIAYGFLRDGKVKAG